MDEHHGTPGLLEVKSLSVRLGKPPVRAVDKVSFSMSHGEILGMAGESGSGKSVTALALTRLLPRSAGAAYSGEVRLRGHDGNLLQSRSRELYSLRGNRIGYVFQEPSSSFNPVYTINDHLQEIVRLSGVPAGDRLQAVDYALERVGIPATRANLDAYPADFSGGMLQRLAIACALIPQPDLLIADEPTTALDTFTQKKIVDLLRNLSEQQGMAVLFISHDLALLNQIAPAIVVMQGGVIVERGASSDVLHQPRHEYTKSLVRAIPRLRLPG